MREAGLTRGGFYYHFSSKRQLYGEAIAAAANQRHLRARTVDDEWVAALLQELADSASGARDGGLAFLATDLRRTEDEVRSAYTCALLEMGAAAHIRGGADEDAALAVSAMIIGTAALIQTTDDERLKGRLFAACQQVARSLLDSSHLPSRFSYFWATADN